MAHVVNVVLGAGVASCDVQSGAVDIGREAETLRSKVDEFLRTVREDSGERRRFERNSGGGVAAVLRVVGRDTVQAIVLDLSRSGVALVAKPILIGTEAEVELPGTKGAAHGSVSRTEAGLIAIAFWVDAAIPGPG